LSGSAMMHNCLTVATAAYRPSSCSTATNSPCANCVRSTDDSSDRRRTRTHFDKVLSTIDDDHFRQPCHRCRGTHFHHIAYTHRHTMDSARETCAQAARTADFTTCGKVPVACPSGACLLGILPITHSHGRGLDQELTTRGHTVCVVSQLRDRAQPPHRVGRKLEWLSRTPRSDTAKISGVST
jgi:hypothetical protein